MRTIADINGDLATLRAKRKTCEVDMAAADQSTAGGRERRANLERGLTRFDDQIEQLTDEWRDAMRRRIDAGTVSLEPGWCAANGSNMNTTYEPADPTGAVQAGFALSEPVWERAARRDALKTIERYSNHLTAPNNDRLEQLVRRPDAAYEAAYLAAIGNPSYRSAFYKCLLDPTPTAHMRFTAAEREAWDRVNEVRAAPLAIGVGSTGGYAVPTCWIRPWLTSPRVRSARCGASPPSAPSPSTSCAWSTPMASWRSTRPKRRPCPRPARRSTSPS